MDKKIIDVLRKNNKTGLNIAELSKKLKASRFVIRSALYRLEILDKVYFRRIVTGKFYFLNGGKK